MCVGEALRFAHGGRGPLRKPCRDPRGELQEQHSGQREQHVKTPKVQACLGGLGKSQEAGGLGQGSECEVRTTHQLSMVLGLRRKEEPLRHVSSAHSWQATPWASRLPSQVSHT